MRKRLGLVVVVLAGVLAASVSSCDRRPLKTSPNQTDPIVIGSALPFSGPVSYYGESSKRGMLIALDDLKAEGGIGGREVRVLYEDTRGTAKDALAAVRKLIDINSVPAIIGAGSSTETLAVARVAEENKVVLLSPVSSAAEIRDAGNYIFRTVPSDGYQAIMLARLVYGRGAHKIGLIFVNSSWGTSIKNHFVREYESLGGTIQKTEATDMDDRDFRTSLLNLSKAQPDAVVAITYAKGGGQLLKQARELGIQLQFYGADPWTISDFLEIAGPAAEGAIYTTPGKYDGEAYKRFRGQYTEKYGSEPDVYAGNGYDCIALLARCLREGARTGSELQKALANIHVFQGVSGTITFDEHGDVTSKEFVEMTIRDGKAVLLNH